MSKRNDLIRYFYFNIQLNVHCSKLLKQIFKQHFKLTIIFLSYYFSIATFKDFRTNMLRKRGKQYYDWDQLLSRPIFCQVYNEPHNRAAKTNAWCPIESVDTPQWTSSSVNFQAKTHSSRSRSSAKFTDRRRGLSGMEGFLLVHAQAVMMIRCTLRLGAIFGQAIFEITFSWGFP